MSTPKSAWAGLRERAEQPIDGASLAVFRFAFGLLAVVGSLRFLAYGWVDRFFVQPSFHFKYFGFSWVEPLPDPWMHIAFGTLAVLGAMIAVGFLYRPAIVAFFLLFTYVELIDVTMYLNHYYLVSLLAFWMCFLPMHRMWSIDAALRPSKRSIWVPAFHLWILRFQVAVVYVFAGLAKFGSDWLIDAQPLSIWLSSRVDTPLIGPLLGEWWVALAMAWAGFLFDTTIVAWLLWPKTRRYAYVAVVGFHLMTGYLFGIGMFPWIMMAAATLLLAPSWPRRFMHPTRTQTTPPKTMKSRYLPVALAGFAVIATLQVLVPLRHLAYPGDVLWSEEGMRWSWKVMVREKNGAVTYRVTIPDRERQIQVSPCDYLTRDQEREFSGQPDMILALGKHIGAQFTETHGHAEVNVDALVSLNGRRPQLLIAPDVDLMTIEDGLMPAEWVLAAPADSPFRPQIVKR